MRPTVGSRWIENDATRVEWTKGGVRTEVECVWEVTSVRHLNSPGGGLVYARTTWNTPTKGGQKSRPFYLEDQMRLDHVWIRGWHHRFTPETA